MTAQEKKQLLVFGYGFALIFSFFAVKTGLKNSWGPSSILLLLLGAGFLIISIFFQPALIRLYRPWMKVVGLIGHIVSTVIYSVVFYVVLGITGMILRLLKKDFLDRRIEVSKNSYWIHKETVPFDPKQYHRQF